MLFLHIIKNLFFHIFLFFKHWYWNSGQLIYGWTLQTIRNMERRLALRINMRFMFQPLYQEYNIYGYILGFMFRAFRIITGGISYILIIIFASITYLVWVLIPIFIVYRIIQSI
ncbi:MAG TPA: hypothetical protein PK367_02405 [Candidatus Paceibacterota bacterium]|nr:hypothetical protein [Candidatus Paceibacterota bacterium]